MASGQSTSFLTDPLSQKSCVFSGSCSWHPSSSGAAVGDSVFRLTSIRFADTLHCTKSDSNGAVSHEQYQKRWPKFVGVAHIDNGEAAEFQMKINKS